MKASHPAKFNAKVIERMADYIPAYSMVLDPFAGVGGIARLHDYIMGLLIVGIELEEEWASQAVINMICGDCLSVMADMYGSVRFDVICTSPTYGNRMADSHTPSKADTSRRNTYTHVLGRKLASNNSGAMQWGKGYRVFHKKAWKLATLLVRPGGLFVLNCKDHYRDGELQRVTDWHTQTLVGLGWNLVSAEKVKTPGMRDGANANVRVDFEWVKVFQLPSDQDG